MQNYRPDVTTGPSRLFSGNLMGTANRSAEDLFWEKFLFLDRLRDLYQKARKPDDRPILENLLNELQVRYEVDPEDLAGIPKTGPVVVVANHPFGMLEGAILGTMLPHVRPDVKIMANYLLAGLPEIEDRCIFVDPFKGQGSVGVNSRALRKAIRWLKSGGLLVVFPAGEVSHWKLLSGEVADPEWSDTVARLARMTGSAVVPVFFKGTNSVPFHLLGMLHPRLRTLRLPVELLNKTGHNVEVRIGTPVPHRAITGIITDRDATYYLRWRTYLLARRGEPELRLVPRVIRSVVPKKPLEPIVAEMPREALIDDIRNLHAEQCLEDGSEYAVYLAPAERLPNVLRELGRLREIAFRQVGEGTGRSTDLDCFDTYYLHLFVWNKARQELVGAYRIGSTQEILALFGPKGLYTSTLFHYAAEFFNRIGPALELGRSFIRPEYQRQYPPLLLLWKGLGAYVAGNPETPVLFGAVSISNEYNPASRRLLAQFLELHRREEDLARLIRPRRPFRPALDRALDARVISSLLPDLDSLSVPISDMEADGKGLPILLKQYVKLGGKLLGFNVDPDFSEALDGLVLVDLRDTDPAVLQRYMKSEGVATFRKYHGSGTTARAGALRPA
jgi:putative hemolysin